MNDFSSILDVILKQNKLIAPLVNSNAATPPTTTANMMMSTCTPVSTASTPSPSMALRMNAITIPKRNEEAAVGQQMDDDGNALFDVMELHGVAGIRKPNTKKKINFACTGNYNTCTIANNSQ